MKKHIHGGDVYRYASCIDFSANCSPLGTPQSVKTAIIQSLSHINDYPQVGCASLKKAIGEYEQVLPWQVICGNGAAELIFSLCHAKKPKKALVLAPSFAEYEQALDSVDCQVRRLLLKEEEGFTVRENLLDALTPDLDIVFLCNPNNPTGLLIRHSLLEEALKRCQERDILLAVDECFLDFVPEPQNHTLKPLLDKYQNLFLLKAFTKRYAMAGVRLGYGLCANAGLLDRMEEVCQPWNVSAMAQAAGIAALKEREYVKESRQTVFREADYLKKELDALGLTVYPSQANYLFFKGPENLFDRCVEKGILIRDCSNYPGLCKGYFRIAVKKHEDNERLTTAFREIMALADR